jgi:aspartyl-tRNA(Asn)/glutamyl-tRNA(Gln) amidotransferase subunit B
LTGLSLKLGTGAFIDIMFHRQKKRIAIQDIRLEAAAGGASLYLRTAADFELGEEAGVFLDILRRRFQYLGLAPEIRCNAGVSSEPVANFVILPDLEPGLAPKAIDAELTRQEECPGAGGPGAGGGAGGAGYVPAAYVPAEDIPPFKAGPVPAYHEYRVELPEARRNRFINEYGLTQSHAEFLCDQKDRADYFEDTTGARAAGYRREHREAAQWMVSFCVKEFSRRGFSPANAPLTPERFAKILDMLAGRRIHHSMARQIITAVLQENRDPEEIVRERGWADRETPGEAVSTGRSDPVCLLCMGGAISGRITAEGIMETGDEEVLRELLARQPREEGTPVQVESLPLGRMLSEEIIPDDWAVLIEAIAEKVNAENTRGIVITHGTDTLPYTAPLLYWLFADAGVPIVLAASSTAPSQGGEAAAALRRAVQLARREEKGVYVVHGGKVLSPLNLKFERIGQDGFRNWNQDIPAFSGGGLLSGPLEADRYVLSQLLEDAVNAMCVVRIYPGLRADYLVSLMDQGVKNFFLELYDTGTAGFREGPYSLRRVFTVGKRRGLHFYCSSQQEGMVDFSLYATSHEVWKEGAVPMGAYTTETAVARYLAASIIADNGEERANLMEGAVGE